MVFMDPRPGGPPPAGTSSTNFLAGYAAQYGQQLGAPRTSSSQEPLIFLGRGSDPNKAPAAVRKGIFDAPPGTYDMKTSTLNEMLSDFEKLSEEKQRRLALLLVLGGYNSGSTVSTEDIGKWVNEASLGDVLIAYSNLLKDAEVHYNQRVTPDQLLNRSIAFRLPSWDGKRSSLDSVLNKLGIDFSGDAASQAGTFTTTSKTKSLDFMDPMDAKALARGVLQQELGRDPTQAEYEDFISAIHAAEARNPNVSTSTTTYTLDDEGRQTDTDTSSTTRQGMTGAGYSQLATEKAQSNPNWAEWQAMGTYAQAFYQSLGASVPGV